MGKVQLAQIKEELNNTSSNNAYSRFPSRTYYLAANSFYITPGKPQETSLNSSQYASDPADATGDPVNSWDPSGLYVCPPYNRVSCYAVPFVFSWQEAESFDATWRGADSNQVGISSAADRNVERRVDFMVGSNAFEVKSGTQSLSRWNLRQANFDKKVLDQGYGFQPGTQQPIPISTVTWDFWPNSSGVTRPSGRLVKYLSGSGFNVNIFYNCYPSNGSCGDKIPICPRVLPLPVPVPQEQPAQGENLPGELGRGAIVVGGGILAFGGAILGFLGGVGRFLQGPRTVPAG